ncbi:MAG: peptide deformylase [Candidatus Chisholmbacteria bacterium RIFCSPHIGHO2_01_FULL_48_12]|uniref:Peptide deformylase n=1 Tax=Candidatus Chisholmbacteria bacterium RIFCSPHIGHO2_01_FULL_48_12 TaxID=1797589 RepID=A0A1G1VJJ9_9BACT|nr:MAG: peptide deformylase [Candidatus Chisholmbacteria bacterium RIFCSPHIGHO2_01_FULL_48_12]
MLPILQVPNPILRQKSTAVVKIDKKVLQFINRLKQTLIHQDHPKGVGLSAIQVGQPWRIFLTYLPSPQNRTIQVFINPEIVSVSKKLTLGPNPQKPILEGCLSIPRIYGPVYRHQWVKLKYKYTSGVYLDSPKVKTVVVKFTAFPARVIQHELDHLNGILFPDRSLKDNLPLYQEINDKLESATQTKLVP